MYLILHILNLNYMIFLYIISFTFHIKKTTVGGRE